MLLFVQQRLVFVLAVYVNQQFGHLLNLPGGNGFPVDTEHILPRLHPAADEHHVLLQRNFQFLQFLPQRPILRRASKHQFHQSALRPLTKHILVKSGSQCQIDRTNQNRFAGAGLTGQYI